MQQEHMKGIPQKILENNKTRIWDFFIEIDKQILANLPDTIVIDKNHNSAPVIDITVQSIKR